MTMPIVYYPAIIERGTRPKSFGVFFPDLPGCTSAGDSAQDAARNAEDALRGHLSLMIEDGERLPPPSDVAARARDPEVKEVARALVRAELPGKAVRLNISMEESVVAQMGAGPARRSSRSWCGRRSGGIGQREKRGARHRAPSLDHARGREI